MENSTFAELTSRDDDAGEREHNMMLPNRSSTEQGDLLLNYDSRMNNIKFIKRKAQSVLSSLFHKLLQHCWRG